MSDFDKNGYFMKRIEEDEKTILRIDNNIKVLEQRKAVLNNQVQKAYDSMNNLTQTVSINPNSKDKQIHSLKTELKKSKDEVKKLKKERTQLKHDVDYVSQRNSNLSTKINELENEILFLNQFVDEKPKIKNNIFDELLEES